MARAKAVQPVGRMQYVRVPAGKPPVALKGQVTKESLLKWAKDTREWYLKNKNTWLDVEALIYFIDMYFIDPTDHKKANKVCVDILSTLPRDPPQRKEV